MAIAVVLVPASDEALVELRPSGLEQVAALGVTNVALVRDGATVGFVLEGWAFDADRAPEAASVALGTRDGVRTLRPLMQMAIANDRVDGARRDGKDMA